MESVKMAVNRLASLMLHLRTKSFIHYNIPTLKQTSMQHDLSSFWRSFSRNANSRTVEISGINFHYEVVGNGEHPVLLLPGALGCSQTDFLPQLDDGLNQKKYTIIAFDPRGYGKSRPPQRDWPLCYLQRDAEDAGAFMQTLGFELYSVLGWSDGGITGLILAGAYPDRVKKLLIWGANAFITEKDVNLYKSIEDIYSWSERMRAPFLDVYGEEYFRSQWKNWVAAVSKYLTERNGDICMASLPKVQCKTLIVNGLKDALVPQEHATYLQKHIANCRTIDWPEGKHNLHMKFHKEFNATAEDFLDE